MEKEGSVLADRPRMIGASEFLSGDKRIALVGTGERFRRLRKAIHTHFQAKAVEMYKDIQLEHARTLILDLLDDPDNHQKHVHRYVPTHCGGGVYTALMTCATLGMLHLSSYVLHTESRVPPLSTIQSL